MQLLALVLPLLADFSRPAPPPRAAGEIARLEDGGGRTLILIRGGSGAKAGQRYEIRRDRRRVGILILKEVLAEASEIRIWIWSARPGETTRPGDLRKGDELSPLP